MDKHTIGIIALGLMFVIATALPINMGVIAFVGAFLVGTLVAGMNAKAIIAGFPADLFLTLAGITYLFAIAQNNGTIDWLVRLAVRAVRGRVAAIPWVMFFITAALTAVGAVSPAAVAIVAPIALGFAAKYNISPLMMGLFVVHGAQGGGFTPISIYGGITNKVVATAGLPISPTTTMLFSFATNLAVAVLLFFLMGGMALLRRKSVDDEPALRSERAVRSEPAVRSERTVRSEPSVRPDGIAGAADDLAPAVGYVAVAQEGPQVFGDAEDESFLEERRRAHAPDGKAQTAAPARGSPYQVVTLASLAVLAVGVLVYKLDIGLLSLTLGLLLSLMAPTMQRRAIGQVSWPEITLIVGVGTYVSVLEKMGTIAFVGNSVAQIASPLTAALVLLLTGAVVSAFASSVAVLGSLIPLAVPFLQGGSGVEAIGFVAAMAVASTIVDVSPFSTNGALVLANAVGVDRDRFFRQLLTYGAIVTVVAPIVVWFLMVVL